MNQTELVELVAQSANLKKAAAKKVIGVIIAVLTDILKKGERVQVLGFGSFEAVIRKDRTVINPQTGIELVIPGARVPKFSPDKALKEAVMRQAAERPRRLNISISTINAPTELVEMVAKSANLSKEVSGKAVESFFSTMTDALKIGERVGLVGFGSFGADIRQARTGRNPQTGKEIRIPAPQVPKFIPGRALREAVMDNVNSGLESIITNVTGIRGGPIMQECIDDMALSIEPNVASLSVEPKQTALKPNHHTISVFFGTDREIADPSNINNFFGNERSDKFHLGYCDVSIPLDHKIGDLKSPSIWKLEFRYNPSKHVVLLKVEEVVKNKFYSKLKKVVTESQEKDIFVFVHGFNVTFMDAIRRTAQIAYDLQFKGAPIAYSWPSKGKLKRYIADETNVQWTINHLKDFLYNIAQKSDASKIHIIAHSMGNRALTDALSRLSNQLTKPLYNEIILTAPDIDSEIFCNDIAPAILSTAKRFTLYSSSNDVALKLSKEIHGYPRAGESGEGIVIVPGIDTIDVSAVDTNLIGHFYYRNNRSVISDMFNLIRGELPDERFGLRAKEIRGLKYWVFNP